MIPCVAFRRRKKFKGMGRYVNKWADWIYFLPIYGWKSVNTGSVNIRENRLYFWLLIFFDPNFWPKVFQAFDAFYKRGKFRPKYFWFCQSSHSAVTFVFSTKIMAPRNNVMLITVEIYFLLKTIRLIFSGGKTLL